MPPSPVRVRLSFAVIAAARNTFEGGKTFRIRASQNEAASESPFEHALARTDCAGDMQGPFPKRKDGRRVGLFMLAGMVGA